MTVAPATVLASPVIVAPRPRGQLSRFRLLRFDGAPLRIVIVEDEGVVALDLALMVEQLGGRVAGIAGSVREAMHIAATLAPDVALMDIRLPDGDGVDVARHLRLRHRTPVVFVTACTEPATLARVAATGGAELVSKPASIEALRGAILKVTDLAA